LRRLPIIALLTLVSWVFPIQEAQAETKIVFSKIETKQVIYRPYTHEFKPIQIKANGKRNLAPKTSGKACSCVRYVRAKTGFTQSFGPKGKEGWARYFPVNSNQPSAGAVIVTYESSLGHVGIVSHWDDSYVYLESEANYSRCRITYGRKIPRNSKLIKGYYVLQPL
jgi:hypothetical protein